MDNKESNQKALQGGDWIIEHRQFLLQFAISKVDDYHVAEDLVQEAFVSAWKARDQFRGDCSERAFLTCIIKNKIIDFYRYRGRRPMLPVSQLGNRDEREFSDLVDQAVDEKSDGNPLVSLDRADFIEQLNQAIDLLPEKMRRAFLLWQIQSRPTEEVLRTMNISSPSLWMLLHRAKKRLRVELAEEWEDVQL